MLLCHRNQLHRQNKGLGCIVGETENILSFWTISVMTQLNTHPPVSPYTHNSSHNSAAIFLGFFVVNHFFSWFLGSTFRLWALNIVSSTCQIKGVNTFAVSAFHVPHIVWTREGPWIHWFVDGQLLQLGGPLPRWRLILSIHQHKLTI